jgi:hypothetical protein
MHFELTVMASLNFKLSLAKKAGSDELCSQFLTYCRFAQMVGIEPNQSSDMTADEKKKCKAFYMGLYLLYLCLFLMKGSSSDETPQVTNNQIACSCLHLAMRMILGKSKWPSYLYLASH